MSNGHHAAPNNSFQRSASGTVVRGALLIIAALVFGTLLLQRKDPGASTVVAGNTTVDTTIAAGDSIPEAATTTTVLLRAPSLVKVLTVNGSGKNRAAARVNSFLRDSGYDLQRAADAIPLPNANVYQDQVFYTPGYEAEAADVATRLQLAPTNVGPAPQTSPVKTPPAAPEFNVMIMVGPNLASRYATQPLTGDSTAAVPDAAAVTTTTLAPVA